MPTMISSKPSPLISPADDTDSPHVSLKPVWPSSVERLIFEAKPRVCRTPHRRLGGIGAVCADDQIGEAVAVHVARRATECGEVGIAMPLI